MRFNTYAFVYHCPTGLIGAGFEGLGGKICLGASLAVGIYVNVKSAIFIILEIVKFQLFHITPSNFACLIVKTTSPGPAVSVPTLGS